MSEELTRFPIHPDDRRRTSRSSKNIKTVPDEQPDQEELQDKPSVPPHERRDRAGDQRDEESDQP